MADEMRPGLDFDQLLGEAFGIPYERRWAAMNADETALCLVSDRREEIDEYLFLNKKKYPNGWLVTEGYHRVEMHDYPFFTRSLDAAWLLVERLRERNFWFSALYKPSIYLEKLEKFGCEVVFQFVEEDGPKKLFTAVAPTLPHAICLAAWQIHHMSKVDKLPFIRERRGK